VGALAGAGAEFADASNRYHHGDIPGAFISGLGALGSTASVIPFPLTRGVGTALSLGAPALNYAIDKYRGAPVKKADGGGIRLSQDDVINNALNKPSRVDVLKRMGSDLGKQALDQGKKEFKSYSKPHAFTDIGNDWVSSLVGAPVDLANLVLQPVGLGSDNPVLGSKYLRDLMIKNNMHTGEERPLTNIGTSFIMPQTAVKGLAKGLELAKDRDVGMSIKNVGGQWLKGATDPAFFVDQKGNDALSNWYKTTVRKYQQQRMGTPNDEIKALMDQGISHIKPEDLGQSLKLFDVNDLKRTVNQRADAGFPMQGEASTPLGITWETVSDASINRSPAANASYNDIMANPWIENVAPTTPIHDTNFSQDYLSEMLGFTNMADALRSDMAAGKLRPEQLNKVSIEDAVRRAHQQRLEHEAETQKALQAIPKVREYPEGYAWHDLTHKDENTLQTMLNTEGETMQNCVGESCADILENGTKIYSLRDAHGNPHVNVEVLAPSVKPHRRPEYIRWEDAPEELKQQFGPQVVKRMEDNPGASYVHPERLSVAIDSDFLPKINQIKGKQNRTAVKDYHPYVQDFINNPVEGQNFSEIKDIASAGMEDADRIRKHGLAGNSMSPYYDALDRIFPSERGVLAGPLGVRIPATQMLKMATQDLPGKYVTQQDVINHLAAQEARPMEQSFSKYYENLGIPYMAGGRSVAQGLNKVSDAYRKAEAMIEAENNRKKFSQVLVPHEGSYLGLTQSDNFGIHGNRYGGTQFPMFQQFSPIHKDNKVVWMNDSEAHANAMAKNSTYNNKPVVWSNYIGAPDQLRSNKSVFQDVLDAHYGRDLTPFQIDLINARIKALSKGNAKDPAFQEPFDIRDKFAVQELGGDTFGSRRALVDMLGDAVGVSRTAEGKQIALPYLQDILTTHRDPITEGVGTSSIGSRLFKVDPTPSSYSKEYHPDYNWTVHGEDLNQPFDFTPHSVLDWYDRQFNLVNKKGETGKVPHGNSWFGYMKDPQFINDKFIQKVEDAGYATGGQVPHMAGGKSVAGALEAVANAYKKASAVPNQYPKAAETLAGLNLTNNDVEAWRAANQFGGRQVQHPMLKTAANDLLDGKINSSQYRDLTKQYLPIKPLTSIPEMPSHQDIASSLSVNKLNKGIVGYNNHIPDGTRVASRLDIPAYDFYNKWIVSLHDGTTPKGKSVGYGQTASLKSTPDNPIEFYSDPKIAADIAAGRTNKTPIARIHGDWENHDSQALHEYAQTLLDHPDWVQVGMNPYRHSYFYDKADMMPLTHAEEVIQIGPLVLAKKPVKTTPDDPRFRIDPNDPDSITYKKGGSITPSQMRQELQHFAGGKSTGMTTSGSSSPYKGDLLADAIKPTGRFIDTSGIKNVNFGTDGQREYGFYNPESPDEINLNPDMFFGHIEPSETFAHEHQHLLDYKNPTQGSVYGNPIGRMPNVDKIMSTSKVINDAANKYRLSNDLSDDFTGKGFYPELARIQSKLPVGKNVFDTPMGKELANKIPELKSYFYQATTPIGGTEMHSAGLPGERVKPIKNNTPTLKSIQNWMRNKTAY
jgi:hypothetical protein